MSSNEEEIIPCGVRLFKSNCWYRISGGCGARCTYYQRITPPYDFSPPGACLEWPETAWRAFASWSTWASLSLRVEVCWRSNLNECSRCFLIYSKLAISLSFLEPLLVQQHVVIELMIMLHGMVSPSTLCVSCVHRLHPSRIAYVPIIVHLFRNAIKSVLSRRQESGEAKPF